MSIPLNSNGTGKVLLWESIICNNFCIWDTLLYLPLNTTDTYTDKSWHNVMFVNSWTTFWTYQWVNCAYFNWNSYIYSSNEFTIPETWTACVRCYVQSTNGTMAIYWSTDTRSAVNQTFYVRTSSNQISYNFFVTTTGSSAVSVWIGSFVWKWIMICRAWDWNRLDCYAYNNWTKYTWYKEPTSSQGYISKNETVNLTLWIEPYTSWGYNNFNWYMSEFWIKKTKMTSAEIDSYYNSTKSKYWY